MANLLSSSDDEINIEIEVECGCYSDDDDDPFSSCHSQFYSTYNSCGGGMSRRVSFSDSCSVDVDDDDDLHLISHLDKVVADNPPPHPPIEEKDCRICHMSLVIEDDDAIELGCCCKDDLAAAHKHCALTWFQIKGNKYDYFPLTLTCSFYVWPKVLMEAISLPLGRGKTVYISPPPYPAYAGIGTCEICNSVVTNLVIPNEVTTNPATIDMNPAATSVATTHMSTTRGGRGCINGHRLLNFILACLVFAFVISWLFHFNIPS